MNGMTNQELMDRNKRIRKSIYNRYRVTMDSLESQGKLKEAIYYQRAMFDCLETIQVSLWPSPWTGEETAVSKPGY